MKSVNVRSALRAGVGGTLAMTALMYAAPRMGLPAMDLLKALGSVLPLGISPYIVGALIHVAIGVTLALLYAAVFDGILPGPRWARGAAFSLVPWFFAITLMAPTMAWLGAVVNHAEARSVANPCAAVKPANPCSVNPAPRVMNPCAPPPALANPGDASAARAAAMPGASAPSPWLLRVMSLMAHMVYGIVLATVYRRRA